VAEGDGEILSVSLSPAFSLALALAAAGLWLFRTRFRTAQIAVNMHGFSRISACSRIGQIYAGLMWLKRAQDFAIQQQRQRRIITGI